MGALVKQALATVNSACQTRFVSLVACGSEYWFNLCLTILHCLMASVAADCSVAADMQQAALKKSQSMSWEQWRLRAIQAIMKCLLDELQQHQNVSDAVHVTLRTFHHFTTAYETLDSFIAEVFFSMDSTDNVCVYAPFLYHFQQVLQQCAGDLDYILSSGYEFAFEPATAIKAFYAKINQKFFDTNDWTEMNVDLKGAPLPWEFAALLQLKMHKSFTMKAVHQLEVVYTSLNCFLTSFRFCMYIFFLIPDAFRPALVWSGLFHL